MAEAVGILLLEAVGVVGAESTILIPGLSLAGAVGGAALIGGSIAASYLLQSTPEVPKPTDGTQVLKQGMPPRIFGYGRARLAGAYMLYETGTDGYSYDVMALHWGRIHGFVCFYLHDDLVNFSNGVLGGGVVSIQTSTGNDGRYSSTNYNGSAQDCYLDVRKGAATETHYTTVVAGLPEMWTTSHRGDGIASALLRCGPTAFDNVMHLWPRGLPKLSVVADLSPVYDPRSPANSRLPSTTWSISYNPVLQLIDYLTGDRGPQLDWDECIAPVLDELMAEANYCDELVTLADGHSEPRYQSHGWAYATTDPADVIATILATCDGWFAERGDGTISIKVGRYRTPTVTFTDAHILGYSIDKGVPDEEVVNEQRFTYTPPQNHYREAQGDPWQDSASISEIGRVRSRTMALTWVHSHTQARRLAKRAMSRHQATIRGTLQTTLYGLAGLGERWIAVQSDTLSDLANAVIEITRARIDLANAVVSFDFVLVNPNEIDAWDPDTEEGSAPDFLPVPVISVTATGSAGSQRANISFSDPNMDHLSWRVEYKRASDPSWFGQTFATYALPLQTVTLSPGTWFVRCAASAPQGTNVLGNWSALGSVVIV